MKNNLKSFLVGALITSVPMSFYIYLSLEPAGYVKFLAEKSRYSTPLFCEYQPLEHITTQESFSNQSLESFKIIPTTITPTPNPTTIPKFTTQIASYQVNTLQTPEEVTFYIEKYANEYGVDKEMMLYIAECESNFRSKAVNGPYAGIYQFVSSTWISNRRAMGLNENPNLRFNAEEAIKTAAFKMARDGFGAWPVCQKKARSILSSTFKRSTLKGN